MLVQITHQRLVPMILSNDRICNNTKLKMVRRARPSPARPSYPANHNQTSIDTISTGETREGRILLVDPKPKKGLASQFFDVVEKLIVEFMHDSKQPLNLYLSGLYAPVHEETPPQPDLLVKGYLPEGLNGELLMVGPNPKFMPVAGYHWFDGDGMVHGLRIKDGKASYVSRYVRTSRLKQEEYFGGAKFLKIGDLKGLFGLSMASLHFLRSIFKVLDVSYGWGTSNTSLTYHCGNFLVLGETDKPYVLRISEDGDLHTVGMLDYDKRLEHPLTAHPKIDSSTGEMFTFGCQMSTTPYCTYRVISKDGFMHDPVPITLSEPTLMHDFAITKNYAIFMDLPLKCRPKNFVMREPVMAFDATKKARFGVLPRYSTDERSMRWFELPNCFIFHNANAWEDGDEVVLITCRLDSTDSMNIAYCANPFDYKSELYELRFNMKNGLASQKKLSIASVDVPRINDNYIGRKQRFVYATILGKRMGIIKFDMHAEPLLVRQDFEVGGGNIKGIFHLEHGKFVGDTVFVPREPAPGVTSEEDDGYLIFFVYDENTGKSAVNVIDAKTMSSDLVAVVELNRTVPFGFHLYFATEEQLQGQTKL